MKSSYDTIMKIIETILVVIFGLLVLDVLWQVFSRFVIGRSSSFTEEFARFALIWLSVLGAAYLNGLRAHLSIDYLLKKLPALERLKRIKIIEFIMAAFALVVLVVGGLNLVYITLHLGQTSPALRVPLGYVYMIVPISGLLILYFSIHHITTLSKEDEY